MIEPLQGFADNVIAVECRGHVTRADYDSVLIPLVEAKLRAHEKLRLYYRAGPQFDGIDPAAMLEDARVGLAHFSRWERAAIVTDIEWLRIATKVFGFLMPCPVKCFPTAQEPEARRWIAE